MTAWTGINGQHAGDDAGSAGLTVAARPERQLIRRTGSFRHVDFRVRVDPDALERRAERTPLTIGLVLDRSGSMSGPPLAMAKEAALAVLEQLDERDRIALVAFDDEIDLLQPVEPVTPRLRSVLRNRLARLEARASTALHEAWLTGCRAIAAPTADEASRVVTRCLLLTDGQANVGLTDPEAIATQVADVRRQAGIGTSTFGFGPAYDEQLLGPMASAGGGQFHHLRTPEEIRRVVVGELSGLLGVVASHVQLELVTEPNVVVDVVSSFWAQPDAEARGRYSITVGEVLRDEDERHLVVRFSLPPENGRAGQTIRWRALWVVNGVHQETPWQEVTFRYESHARCDEERRDPEVMRWVGLQHADRARREAVARNQRGDLHGAQQYVQRVARRLAEYADRDEQLLAALGELRQLEQELASARISSMAAKEQVARSWRDSRGQRDRR